MAVGRPKGRSVSWVCVLRARIAVEEDNLLGQFPDRRSVERLERESVRQSFRQLATGFFPSPAGGIQAVPPYRPCQANEGMSFLWAVLKNSGSSCRMDGKGATLRICWSC